MATSKVAAVFPEVFELVTSGGGHIKLSFDQTPKIHVKVIQELPVQD